ncbi:MAG: hypothetical protein ACR2OC_01185, partial [Solirubrobacterales bacterium]
LQFMYGAPEYGGNRDLVGWRFTNYDGDVQARGWNRAEIEQPGSQAPAAGSRLEDSPIPVERLIALTALGASAEAANGVLSRSEGSLSGLRREIGPVIDAIEAGELDPG